MDKTVKIELGAEIEVYLMDRICVMIVTEDGFIYENDVNHQTCMLEMCATYWSDRGINIDDMDKESEMAKAIEITDTMFRENKLFGFDVYSDLENNYLVSHYPQNLEKCYEQVEKYAKEHDMILATFDERDRLGHNCFEVTRRIA